MRKIKLRSVEEMKLYWNDMDKIWKKKPPAFSQSVQMISELQDKNATLRLALGKLLKMCKNYKMQDRSEIWCKIMGVAEEAMNDTDPNEITN